LGCVGGLSRQVGGAGARRGVPSRAAERRDKIVTVVVLDERPEHRLDFGQPLQQPRALGQKRVSIYGRAYRLNEPELTFERQQF
jgi:hypothetical protein